MAGPLLEAPWQVQRRGHAVGRERSAGERGCWGSALCSAEDATLVGKQPSLGISFCKAQRFTCSLKSLGDGFSPRLITHGNV